MPKSHAKRVVNLPHKAVWKLLSDLKSPSKYHPMVSHVEITSTHSKGIGATRRVHYVDGGVETEEVVQVGQGYIIFKSQNLQGKQEKDLIATYSVRGIAANRTEVSLEATYNRPPEAGRPRGIILRLLPSSKSSTEKRMQQRLQLTLEGIDYHLSTRQSVRKMSFSGKPCGAGRSSVGTIESC